MSAYSSATLRALARRDPALGRAMATLPPCPRFPVAAKRRQTHFESLAQAIVYQQLAGKAAATIYGRVVALTHGPRLASPQVLQTIPDQDLRAAGLSANKLAALRDLAARSLDGRLPLRRLGRQTDAQILDELVQVRGIGPWTAQMFLMFKLGRQDILATGDLGLQEGLRRLDGLAERPTPQDLESRGAVWAPYRSIASWYLWRLADQA